MALVLVLGPLVLPEYRDSAAGRPDLLSGVLSIGAMLAVIFGLKQIVQDGLTLVPALSIVVGVALAAVFVRRQLLLVDPMLDLTLFRNRTFNVSLTSNVLNVFVSFGTFILVSQFRSDERNWTQC